MTSEADNPKLTGSLAKVSSRAEAAAQREGAVERIRLVTVNGTLKGRGYLELTAYADAMVL